MKRVVVTGMAGISPLGQKWADVSASLRTCRNAVQRIEDWRQYDGLYTQIGAPVPDFETPQHYSRKATRSMGRNALMAVTATERALVDAGLLDHPALTDGSTGIAYGSSSGTPKAVGDFGRMLERKSTEGINANTYIKMMSHTAAVNIDVFFGITGRVVPTSSACTSGSQGVGYAYEAVRYGLQPIMVAGGSEELCATQAAVFDTLFATSVRNAEPGRTPRPFDKDRDGLVLGEGAGTLILEELEHARRRGAPIHSELVGFGTNSDGTHVTQPNAATMERAMRLALDDAGIGTGEIGYVNAHGTATEQGDIAESMATAEVFNRSIPISSLKSYMGHTLGACGVLEAWMSIEMMRDGWFAPTLNLESVDPRCADLGYIADDILQLGCDYVMCNNFAFGGINTSLIFKRWQDGA